MRAPAEREFLLALRELDGRLAVPIPERVRILRELEFDLEQLHARFIASGLRAEAARARALEALLPTPGAVEQLASLHAPVYQRLTRGLSEDRLRLLERTALALATAAVLLVEAFVLLRSWRFSITPWLIAPVLGAGTLLFAVIAATGFRLWVRGDHSRARRGVDMVLGLAGATLFVGLVSAFADTYRVTATLAVSPELAATLVLQWLRRDAALLSVSILIALAGALAWFVMTQRVAAISWAHRDALGLDPFDASWKGDNGDG